MDTSGFKAEYGQGGGGMITFASKSGTNDLHGVAYEFLRNDDFDARGFFAPTRSVYKQSDFGVAAGGPVEIPKLYHGRNRTFFFLSYEGFRNRVGNNGSILTVPTPILPAAGLCAIPSPATRSLSRASVRFPRKCYPMGSP